MGGMNENDGAEALAALRDAMTELDKMFDRVRMGYTAAAAHPENTAVAMILTPEFEAIAQRKDKLESALIAAQKILQEAIK
jgi:hypothetical protein